MATTFTGRHSAGESVALRRRPRWAAVLRRLPQQVKHHDTTDRAAALTYFGLLAIFPGVLVLVSILGLVGRSTTQTFLNNVRDIAPAGVFTFLQGVIDQVQGRQGAAVVAAIVGSLLALWSASGYVAAFTRAMNSVYGIDEGRPIWRTAPLRLAVTIAVVIMLVASAVIVTVTGPVASRVGHGLGLGDAVVTAWNIAKWPVLLLIVGLTFSLLYSATPNVKRGHFRWITPGGVLAVVIWLVASGVFAVYASFSASYNKTYGSLAGVIIFLVWLWLTNLAILLGAEFNAEMERQRMIEAGLPEDTEPFVELRDTRKLSEAETMRVQHAEQVRRTHVARSGEHQPK
jgi:membrane protein